MSFSVEFKRQVIEELLSGESRPAKICHRYNIQSSLLYSALGYRSPNEFEESLRVQPETALLCQTLINLPIQS